MAEARELLQLSAELAWRLAPKLCRKDPSTAENCAWTHGLWPTLRTLGLVGSIDDRAEFFGRALAKVTGNAPRVLLSGAADYATLAFVLSAFQAHRVKPQITVIDLCETPLALNRWYAERLGCAIETSCCDILEFIAENPFDAICTDAFLGRFPFNRRAALIARWHDLLRPGGLAITYNRVRPAGGDAAVGFAPAQAETFALAVTAAAQPLLSVLGTDADTMALHARNYANRHSTFPVRSAQEFRALFESAGFKVECLETVGAAVEAGAVSGPSTRDGGTYVGIVGSRR